MFLNLILNYVLTILMDFLRFFNNFLRQKIVNFLNRWLCSINHKDIGLLYLIFGAIAGLIGTLFSLLIRLELAIPGTVTMSGDYQWVIIIIIEYIFFIIYYLLLLNYIYIFLKLKKNISKLYIFFINKLKSNFLINFLYYIYIYFFFSLIFKLLFFMHLNFYNKYLEIFFFFIFIILFIILHKNNVDKVLFNKFNLVYLNLLNKYNKLFLLIIIFYLLLFFFIFIIEFLLKILLIENGFNLFIFFLFLYNNKLIPILFTLYYFFNLYILILLFNKNKIIFLISFLLMFIILIQEFPIILLKFYDIAYAMQDEHNNINIIFNNIYQIPFEEIKIIKSIDIQNEELKKNIINSNFTLIYDSLNNEGGFCLDKERFYNNRLYKKQYSIIKNIIDYNLNTKAESIGDKYCFFFNKK